MGRTGILLHYKGTIHAFYLIDRSSSLEIESSSLSVDDVRQVSSCILPHLYPHGFVFFPEFIQVVAISMPMNVSVIRQVYRISLEQQAGYIRKGSIHESLYHDHKMNTGPKFVSLDGRHCPNSARFAKLSVRKVDDYRNSCKYCLFATRKAIFTPYSSESIYQRDLEPVLIFFKSFLLSLLFSHTGLIIADFL